METKIEKVVIQLGDKEHTFTYEELLALKDVISKLFPQENHYAYPVYVPVVPNPYPYWRTTWYCSDGTTTTYTTTADGGRTQTRLNLDGNG